MKAFVDTNVLLYLLSADREKADKAEDIVRAGPLISVQVLNEIANVSRRKLRMPWADVQEFLTLIRSLCPVEPLTLEMHDKAMQLAQRHMVSFFDALIVSAGLLAECDTLYSEDMQNDLVVDGRLRICNPFL